MSGVGQGYGEGFFYTPEDQAQQQSIRQRQAYAQALLQSRQHQGQYGGLADAGDKIAGALMGKYADKDAQKLALASQERDTSTAQGLAAKLMQKTSGIAPIQTTVDGTAPQLPGQTAPQPQGPQASFSLGGQAPQPMMSSQDQLMALLSAPRVGPQTAALQQAMIPQIMGRENKVWENENLGMSRAAREQSGVQLQNQEALAEHNNQLAPTKQQQALIDLQRAQFGETGRHNRASEANAAQSAEFGKGMQGRAYNILAQGIKNPALRSSAEYQTAWQILSNPKVDPNTGTVVVPDLSAFAPPLGAQPPGAPGQPQPVSTPGAPLQRMPSIQAFAPPNPSGPEALSAGYANRLQSAAADLDKNSGALTSLSEQAKSKVPVIGNKLVSEEYQMGNQAERNFINAQLRRESGAAIAESEFENARKQYIPQPFDGPKVLAQKKAARDMAIRNMQLSAGNTLLPPGVIQNASPPRNAPAVPQNQGFGLPNSGSVPPPAQRTPGQVYQTPKGPMTWTGAGWQPQ